MKLPFLISVPHSGHHIPQEVQDICILTPEQIYEDSDWGAAEIYFALEKYVEAFIYSDVARAIVDLNRAADDFTCLPENKSETFSHGLTFDYSF